MATKVKVAARLRPFINTEHPDDTVTVSPSEGSISIVNLRNSNERFKFSFTSCYDQTASQEQIFETDVRPLVEHVLNGLVYVTCFLAYQSFSGHVRMDYELLKSIPDLSCFVNDDIVLTSLLWFSCTVFAYGVTSSGKTHTIQGNSSEPGIIPRAVKVSIKETSFQKTQHWSFASERLSLSRRTSCCPPQFRSQYLTWKSIKMRCMTSLSQERMYVVVLRSMFYLACISGPQITHTRGFSGKDYSRQSFWEANCFFQRVW